MATNWSKQWEPNTEKEQPFIFRCSCDWLNVCIILSRDAALVGNFLQYLRGVKKSPHVAFKTTHFAEWLMPQRCQKDTLRRGLKHLDEMGLIKMSKSAVDKHAWCVDILELPKYHRLYPWNDIKTHRVE